MKGGVFLEVFVQLVQVGGGFLLDDLADAVDVFGQLDRFEDFQRQFESPTMFE